MQGYNSIKQYIEDYILYLSASQIDPGRSGETVASYLKNQINLKFKNASLSFKSFLKKNNYTKTDLYLIAINDKLKQIDDLQDFLGEIRNTPRNARKIHMILKSNAFKKNRLTILNDFLPKQISSKEDLIEFLKINHLIPHSCLRTILDYYAKNKWNSWLSEAQKEDKVEFSRGRWYA